MTKDTSKSQRERGLYHWLSVPAIYDLFQRTVSGSRAAGFQKLIDNEYMAPFKQCRILDIGCGTGSFLGRLPAELDCKYCGFDLSAVYIEAAKTKYRNRGEFFCQRVSEATLDGLGPFDIVLAMGVMHHLDDAEALTLTGLAHKVLVPGGRLVTVDGVFAPGQGRLAQWIVSLDRGKFIRTPSAYEALARKSFATVAGTVFHNMIRLPYSHFVMKCVK